MGVRLMMMTTLLVIAVAALVVSFLTPLARALRRGRVVAPDIQSWPAADARVVSVLRASHRTFLLVRYTVGTQVIHNDVLYPLPGDAPAIGQRVPLRYDPSAPARAFYDPSRTIAPRPRVAA
jgi:hypothetical protein